MHRTSLYTKAKILNLTNIITLHNCILVFDHSPAFDDLFKPLKNNIVTRGGRRYVLNIPKMKTSFYGSMLVQVKSVKDWNDIIDKIHFTPLNFLKIQ